MRSPRSPLTTGLVVLAVTGCGGEEGDGDRGPAPAPEREEVERTPSPESVRASRMPVHERAAPRHAALDSVIRVGFRSQARLGPVGGGRRRAYVITAQARKSMPGCVQQRDVVVDRARAGEELVARLDPARGKGGHLGWCRGSYGAKIEYSDGIACPASGRCQPPEGFERLSRTVGRFAFTVE